jgi:thiol-disulfide isomerase/thioredoxin
MKTLIILVTSIVAGFGLLAGVSERLRPSERKGSENSRSAKLDRAYIADMLKKQGLSVENKIIVGNVWATWCKPCFPNFMRSTAGKISCLLP